MSPSVHEDLQRLVNERTAELRETEEKFQVAFHAMSLGALVMTMDGVILSANPALHEMLGFADLIGRNYFDLLAPSDVPEARAARAPLQSGKAAPRVERRFVAQHGGIVLASVHASTLHDHKGDLTGALVVVEDITERRRIREHMISADRLASLGTLAAGVAHEINNPLAYVLSNLQASLAIVDAAHGRLQGAELDDLRAALADARHGTERVRAIVADLKAFTRFEGDGDEDAADAQHALDWAVRVATSDIRRRARLVRTGEPLPAVRGQGASLGQVFLNLLMNAAQAIEEGHPDENEVRVETSVSPDAAIVAIVDTGCGIAPEHISRIFDPFFTTKPAGSGTGLGLSVCHTTVSKCGGTIEVSSTPGHGSVFRVTLSLWRAQS